MNRKLVTLPGIKIYLVNSVMCSVSFGGGETYQPCFTGRKMKLIDHVLQEGGVGEKYRKCVTGGDERLCIKLQVSLNLSHTMKS